MVRLIYRSWAKEFQDCLRGEESEVRIICPFIKHGVIEALLKGKRLKELKVITRFNVLDFLIGVNDLSALKFLLKRKASVRGVANLHAKVFIFGKGSAIVTSANLTSKALGKNHEFGFVTETSSVVKQCLTYFESLWAAAKPDLDSNQLQGLERKVSVAMASATSARTFQYLGDEGQVIDLGSVPGFRVRFPKGPQAFVKFQGEANNRAALTGPVLDEVDSAGSHLVLAYPKGKRPRIVEDGALMFIGCLTEDPNDIRVLGMATATSHQPGRDDATTTDKRRRGWMKDWPHLIRIVSPKFVGGNVGNGISLNNMMLQLGANAFATTQANARRGKGNTNPRRAYMQQAAVRLSGQGRDWLRKELEAAYYRHGVLEIPRGMK